MTHPSRLAPLLPLFAAVLYSAWLGAWVRWLVRAAAIDRFAPQFPGWLMLALTLLAAFAARRALSSRLPLRAVRWGLIAFGFALVLGAQWAMYGAQFPAGYFRGLVDWGFFISPELIVLLAATFLVWRGQLIGRSLLPHDDLVRAFNVGFFALAVLFIFNRFDPFLSPDEALGPALLFFAAGLGALALSSIERARRQQKEATGLWLALNRYWLITAAAVIGALLGLGLIAVALVSPGSLARLNVLLQPVADLLAPFLFVLALIIALIATPIFAFVGWLSALIGTPPPSPTPTLSLTPTLDVSETAVSEAGQQALIGQRGFGIAAVLVVLFVVMWFAVRRFRPQPRAETDETRESIFSRELIAGQLRKLFARSRARAASAPPPPYLPLAGPPGDPRQRVRRAYQGLLEWAQTLHPPRAPSQTPAAYADALAQAVPEGEEAIAVLTGAYLPARYGAEPPSPDDARRSEEALAQLRAMGIEQ
jgi:hypothetical protein